MSRKRLIFWLWVASGAFTQCFTTGLSYPKRDKESFAHVTDILNDLPHEECDMIVASPLLPQGETPLLIEQGGKRTNNGLLTIVIREKIEGQGHVIYTADRSLVHLRCSLFFENSAKLSLLH